jgi:hypothetical protein
MNRAPHPQRQTLMQPRSRHWRRYHKPCRVNSDSGFTAYDNYRPLKKNSSHNCGCLCKIRLKKIFGVHPEEEEEEEEKTEEEEKARRRKRKKLEEEAEKKPSHGAAPNFRRTTLITPARDQEAFFGRTTPKPACRNGEARPGPNSKREKSEKRAGKTGGEILTAWRLRLRRSTRSGFQL